MIDYNLLRYALAAADTGSFSRAAQRFGIKQSTLSKRIHLLEARLGLALFERSTRGVMPTVSGDRFLVMARRIIEDLHALAGASRALANGTAGILRLGFCGSLATGDFSATLASYRAAFPEIEIEARENGRVRLLDDLENEEIDVVVLSGLPRRVGVASLCFWTEPLTIALPPDNPLSARPFLFWSDLSDFGFIVTADDPGPDIASMITARLAAPGHRPSIVVQAVSRENLAQFGSASLLPVIAGSGFNPLPAPHSYAYCSIHDAAGPTSLDQGVHWRRANSSPALRGFIEHVSRRYARPIPAERS